LGRCVWFHAWGGDAHSSSANVNAIRSL